MSSEFKLGDRVWDRLSLTPGTIYGSTKDSLGQIVYLVGFEYGCLRGLQRLYPWELCEDEKEYAGRCVDRVRAAYAELAGDDLSE